MEGNLTALIGLGRESTNAEGYRDHQSEDDQQGPLDELDVGGGGHPRRSDDRYDDDAHQDHADPVREAQEGLDEDSSPDHLGYQIEDGHDQRRDSRPQLETALVELRV